MQQYGDGHIHSPWNEEISGIVLSSLERHLMISSLPYENWPRPVSFAQKNVLKRILETRLLKAYVMVIQLNPFSKKETSHYHQVLWPRGCQATEGRDCGEPSDTAFNVRRTQVNPPSRTRVCPGCGADHHSGSSGIHFNMPSL